MTINTFNAIMAKSCREICEEKERLVNIAENLKTQYRFSCDNFGSASIQAGYFDHLLCAVQTAIEALKVAETTGESFVCKGGDEK
ncbi:MAG: hypothetical protein LBL82_08310 [Oscillospiraceae bacterium]|jgi:hypothetical protein|nr:hypothetical protein [Oscillospiraceae bacterium]